MGSLELYNEAKILNIRARSMYLESLRLLAIRGRLLGRDQFVTPNARANGIKMNIKATETKEDLIYNWSH